MSLGSYSYLGSDPNDYHTLDQIAVAVVLEEQNPPLKDLYFQEQIKTSSPLLIGSLFLCVYIIFTYIRICILLSSPVHVF